MLGFRLSVSFSNTSLLVVGLPVRTLAILTTVDYSPTTKACRKLGSTITAFGCEAVTADLCVRSWAFLLDFLMSHRGTCLCVLLA
jgi:hypothetical protein